MKRLKKLLLPLSLLAIVPITTIPVVACSKTSNSDNVVQPPQGPNGNQTQNGQYNITGEFAKYYTKSMFEDNLRMMKMFDGSNKVWLNIPQPGSNKPFRFLAAKDVTCLKFQASGNTIEIHIRMFQNPQIDAISNNSNNWNVYEEYYKYEYVSPTEIKFTSDSNDDFFPPSTDIIPMSQFETGILEITPENFMKMIESLKIVEWQN